MAPRRPPQTTRKTTRKPKPRSTLSLWPESDEEPNPEQEPSDTTVPNLKQEPPSDDIPKPKPHRRKPTPRLPPQDPSDPNFVPYIKPDPDSQPKRPRSIRAAKWRRQPIPPSVCTDTPADAARFKARLEEEIAAFKPYTDEVNFRELHIDDKVIESRLVYAAKDRVGEDGKMEWRRVHVKDPMGEECQELFEAEKAEPGEIDGELEAFLETLHGPEGKWSREKDWTLHELVQLERPPCLDNDDPRPICVSITFVLWEPKLPYDPDLAFWWVKEEEEIKRTNYPGWLNWQKMGLSAG